MARVYVKGYTKKDGTKVPGHYRNDGVSETNWLTRRLMKSADSKGNYERLSKANPSSAKTFAAAIKLASRYERRFKR